MDLESFLTYAVVFFAGAIALAISLPYIVTQGFPVNDSNAFGFYQKHNATDAYYCVWVDGLFEKTVATTEYHEACHALIEKDKQHFCS